MCAATIFITGISASGKSTLGKRLKEDLVKSGIDNVRLLDGEIIREQLAKRGKDFGYSTDERNKVALEIAHIAYEGDLLFGLQWILKNHLSQNIDLDKLFKKYKYAESDRTSLSTVIKKAVFEDSRYFAEASDQHKN